MQPQPNFALWRHEVRRWNCTDKTFGRCYGLENVALRYFNILGPAGPRSPYSGVLAKSARRSWKRRSRGLRGMVEQTRDFTFVEMRCRLNLLACEAPTLSGKVFKSHRRAQPL